MKNKLLLAAMLLGGAFAFSTNVEAQNPKETIEGTYYGRRASGNPKYPCSGITTRVCGSVKVETYDVRNMGSLVKYDCTRTIFDENGTMVSTTDEEYIVPSDMSLEIYLEEDALSNNVQYYTDRVHKDNYYTPVD